MGAVCLQVWRTGGLLQVGWPEVNALWLVRLEGPLLLCGEMVMGLQLLRALVQPGMCWNWSVLGAAPRW